MHSMDCNSQIAFGVCLHKLTENKLMLHLNRALLLETCTWDDTVWPIQKLKKTWPTPWLTCLFSFFLSDFHTYIWFVYFYFIDSSTLFVLHLATNAQKFQWIIMKDVSNNNKNNEKLETIQRRQSEESIS